jgi:hypothetical protein
MPKSRKSRSRRRQKRGGALDGAPLNYALAGSWPSSQSLNQGADYFKYHEGQHGGQAPLSAIGAEMLPGGLVGPAHLAGLNKAYADIAGLRDMNGGRRRRHRSKKAKKGGKRKSIRHCKNKSKKGGKRRKHRRTRRRGGAMGYAPFPSQGMLLSGNQYAQAGLNPEWKNAQEFDSAMLRQSM